MVLVLSWSRSHLYSVLSWSQTKRTRDFVSRPVKTTTAGISLNCRGGTVRRCHGSVRTSVRGSRFDTISVQHEKKKIYYARFLFIYFEQTVVQIKKIHLDVKILHITLYI